jgi:hypothetical protein
MSSVAPSPPEQGQLVNVRSPQWVVNVARPSRLTPPALEPTLDGPQPLLTRSSVQGDGHRAGRGVRADQDGGCQRDRRLWDSGDLPGMILKNHDKFPDELKADLPLKRIWALVLGE